MRATVDSRVLAMALTHLVKVAPAKTRRLPVLSHVRMEAQAEAGLLLRVTDLDVSVLMRIQAAVEEEGVALLPLKPLLQHMKALPAKPSGPVTLSGGEAWTRVLCGMSGGE